MKLIFHVFIIYIFAISLLPCDDGGNGFMKIAEYIFDVEHQHNSDHDQHSAGCGDDACTPFCVCSCCSMALDVPTKLAILDKYLPPKPATQPSSFSDFIPSSFLQTIWQPPRFS